MGRTSLFLVRRRGSGWIGNEELPRSAAELGGVEGDGPLIAAQVLHSDVCYVLGRAPGTDEWRWVFGEGAARSYMDEFDPSSWIKSDDPDVLEGSRDRRVAAAANAVIEWAHAADLTPGDSGTIEDVLAAGYVFAEDGLFALLHRLGVDAQLGEQPSAEPTAGTHVTPTRRTNQDPPRAIAIDHSSEAWEDIDAYFLESRFGQPPCIIRWQRSDYVLSDPPVSLGEHSWIGDWVDVPMEHTSEFEAAVAWARANVGTSGEQPSGTRPLLVLDDPPPGLSGWKEMPIWYLHQRADHASVTVWLEVDESLDGSVAARLATSFYDRCIARAVAALGESATATYGSEESSTPHGLVVGGLTLRHDGRIGVTKATETSWRQVAAKLGAGDLVGAMCSVTRTDAHGRANMEPFSHMDAKFEIWNEMDRKDQSHKRVVKVSVDLPYFASIFTPADAEAFARSALTVLPLRRGYVHVGRWADSTEHWIDIVPAAEVQHSKDFALVETHGSLAWLQRTMTPPTPLVEI